MVAAGNSVAASMFSISWLEDSDARVQLVRPLAVVVWAGTHALAPQAHAMLLLSDTARVVKGDASVLRSARVVGQSCHTLLELHHIRVRAPSTRVLLNAGELLVPGSCERELAAHVQERAKGILSC